MLNAARRLPGRLSLRRVRLLGWLADLPDATPTGNRAIFSGMLRHIADRQWRAHVIYSPGCPSHIQRGCGRVSENYATPSPHHAGPLKQAASFSRLAIGSLPPDATPAPGHADTE